MYPEEFRATSNRPLTGDEYLASLRNRREVTTRGSFSCNTI
jgi:hypothetical protein